MVSARRCATSQWHTACPRPWAASLRAFLMATLIIIYHNNKHLDPLAASKGIRTGIIILFHRQGMEIQKDGVLCPNHRVTNSRAGPGTWCHDSRSSRTVSPCLMMPAARDRRPIFLAGLWRCVCFKRLLWKMQLCAASLPFLCTHSLPLGTGAIACLHSQVSPPRRPPPSHILPPHHGPQPPQPCSTHVGVGGGSEVETRDPREQKAQDLG